MLTAKLVEFPPPDLLSLKLLCIQELLIVRNIPLSLSSDTIKTFLKFYGPIKVRELLMKEFQMLSTLEKKRNEALVLFLHPMDAIKVIDAKIQSIGGFYVEKVDYRTHAYLVSSSKFVQDCEHSRAYEENYEDVNEQDSKDLEFSFQSQELGKQLINAYSEVLASGFLTIQNLGGVLCLILDRSGATAIVMAIFTWFSVAKIVSALFLFFKVQERLQLLKERGLEMKKEFSKRPAIKPLVEQAELAHQTVLDILEQTKKIIASKQKVIKN